MPSPLRSLDRLPHPLVDPRPPQRGHALVQRLPDQRVREQVGPRPVVGLDEEHRAERLLERRQELVLAELDNALEQLPIDVSTDHGGDAQQLGRRRLEPAETERDHLLDPLREPEALELGRARAPDLHAGLDQVADDLLDEERVALGLFVQGTRERPCRHLPRPQPHELGSLGVVQSLDVQLGGEPVAAELGQRVRERVAALGRAVRAQDQQTRGVRRPRQVPQQQQRRPVGPLQVVEHEQHRGRTRQVRQQPDDGLEQPVALGLGLVLGRRRQVGHAPAQLGDEPRELGPVLAGVRAQIGEQSVQRPMPKRLQERLIRHHGLARRAPREHDRARAVNPLRELGDQRRFADPGVAGEQHDPSALAVRVEVERPALASGGEVPALLEVGDLRLPSDEGALGTVAQLRR